MVRLTLLLCASAALVRAQSSAPAAGLEPAWDIAVVLNEVGDNASRLLPSLNRMDPKSWVAKGASETYVEQWQSSRDQVRALADGAKALAKNPERLSTSLELFFRIESLDRMLGSVAEGARKYHGAAGAQGGETIYAQSRAKPGAGP